ncbi:hypothetical protein GWI33_012088, partial [Rhynchophorus ferrugineus]
SFQQPQSWDFRALTLSLQKPVGSRLLATEHHRINVEGEMEAPTKS